MQEADPTLAQSRGEAPCMLKCIYLAPAIFRPTGCGRWLGQTSAISWCKAKAQGSNSAGGNDAEDVFCRKGE